MNFSALNDQVQIILKGKLDGEPIIIDPNPEGPNLVEILLLPMDEKDKKASPSFMISIKPKTTGEDKKKKG